MIKVLLLAANPVGTDRLMLEEEKRLIDDAHLKSSQRPQFEIKHLHAPRWGDVLISVRDFQPQIVHFMGHGEGAEGLVLVDDDGGVQPMTGDRWAELLALYPVDCVVLNACSTKIQAEEIHGHVNCVVGMWQKVGDRSGREFAAGFYGALFAGDRYERAYQVGKATIVKRMDAVQPLWLFREKVRAIVELEYPEDKVPLDSPFYVERGKIEQKAGQQIVKVGALIRIKAPHGFGKSSLMDRTLNIARQRGAKTVVIDFQQIDETTIANLDELLQWFCQIVTRKLQLSGRIESSWSGRLGPKDKCSDYFEDQILPLVPDSFVLALDGVDRLFLHKAVAVDFFAMLRAWHEEGKNAEIWQKLRLVIVHATDVYIELKTTQSPFNVGVPIELLAFSQLEIKDLVTRHGLSDAETIAQSLMTLVGGNPKLVRLALYQMVNEQMSWDELMQPMTLADLYRSHLQVIEEKLVADIQLRTEFHRVIMSSSSIWIESRVGFLLRSLGLIEWVGNDVRVSCELYRKYFIDRFSG